MLKLNSDEDSYSLGGSPNPLFICLDHTEVWNTVDVERFAGLNICGFSPIKFSRKYFRGALATSVHYLPIAKNSQENFRGKLKNRESFLFTVYAQLRYVRM